MYFLPQKNQPKKTCIVGYVSIIPVRNGTKNLELFFLDSNGVT
jgi:hypothetical protein